MLKKFFTWIVFQGWVKIKNLILDWFAGPGSAAVWSLVWNWATFHPGLVLANENFAVDELVTSLDRWFLWPVTHITDWNLDLSTFTSAWWTIRWVAVADWQVVYVANQTTTSENGFYAMSTTTHLLTLIRTFDAASQWNFIYPAHDSSNLYIFKYNGTSWSITAVGWTAWATVKYVETVVSQTTVTISAATHWITSPVVQIKWTDNIVVDAQIEIQDDHDVIVTFSESFSWKITIV